MTPAEENSSMGGRSANRLGGRVYWFQVPCITTCDGSPLQSSGPSPFRRNHLTLLLQGRDQHGSWSQYFSWSPAQHLTDHKLRLVRLKETRGAGQVKMMEGERELQINHPSHKSQVAQPGIASLTLHRLHCISVQGFHFQPPHLI